MSGYQSYQSIAPFPSGDREGQPPPSDLPGRKKASVACFACRKRRTKCDGGIPCSACQSHNTECTKDENDDGRRKLAVKRRIEDLENDRQLLDHLFTAIRTGQPGQLDGLLNLVRGNNVTREAILAYLERHFRSSPGETTPPPLDHAPSSSSVAAGPDSRSRRRRMLGRIQDVVNPPLSVRASPWTTVTDDEDFVSHLISLWFTWAHPWYHWVEKDAFLEAMNTGDMQSPLCTSYLVNMILAHACLLDSVKDDEPERNAWIREQFYNEAKRGMEAEQGRPSFALVAALGVQWTYLNTNGQDRLGSPILFQQIYLARDLEKWRARLAKEPDIPPGLLDNVDRSLDRLMWTLFSLSSVTTINLENGQIQKPPSRRKPTLIHDGIGDHQTWVAYPQRQSPTTFHPECHYHSFISLMEKISRDDPLFPPEGWVKDLSETTEMFRRLYAELEEWPQTLPECMRLHENAMPHVVALHMLLNWAVVVISKQAAASDATKSSRPSAATTPDSSRRPQWTEICTTASIRIASLLEQLRLERDADNFPVIILQPASVAGLVLLDSLHDGADVRDAFVKTCDTIHLASRRFRVGKGILLILKQVADQKAVVLPPECDPVFAQLDKDVELQRHLDYLLERWDTLDLEEEG